MISALLLPLLHCLIPYHPFLAHWSRLHPNPHLILVTFPSLTFPCCSPNDLRILQNYSCFTALDFEENRTLALEYLPISSSHLAFLYLPHPWSSHPVLVSSHFLHHLLVYTSFHRSLASLGHWTEIAFIFFLAATSKSEPQTITWYPITRHSSLLSLCKLFYPHVNLQACFPCLCFQIEATTHRAPVEMH